LMETNEVEELWEVRFDIEDEGIIEDLYNPDLHHISRGLDNGHINFVVKDEDDNRGLDNGHINFVVKDEDDKEILTFDLNEMDTIYESMEDEADNIPYEGYLLIPGQGDKKEVDNIFATFDENKGGVVDFEFESDTVPTLEDFCYQHGDIGTPDGDWDFVSKIFFKKEELEVYDGLDNRGKASTVEIYRKDGSIIS